MSYPTLPTLYGANQQPITKIGSDRAEDGSLRGRGYASQDSLRFQFTNPSLSASQVTSVLDFYDASRASYFDYIEPLDGSTRTCVFPTRPTLKRVQGDRWDVTVKLESAGHSDTDVDLLTWAALLINLQNTELSAYL